MCVFDLEHGRHKGRFGLHSETVRTGIGAYLRTGLGRPPCAVLMDSLKDGKQCCHWETNDVAFFPQQVKQS